MFETILKLLLGMVQDYRRVRFRCHWAAFAATGRQALFLTVTNLSKNREIEVTYVWAATTPEAYALPPQRPLPKRLRPDETWETWIMFAELSADERDARLLRLGRLRLSTGRIVGSLPDRSVPGFGTVPGGGGST